MRMPSSSRTGPPTPKTPSWVLRWSLQQPSRHPTLNAGGGGGGEDELGAQVVAPAAISAPDPGCGQRAEGVTSESGAQVVAPAAISAPDPGCGQGRKG